MAMRSTDLKLANGERQPTHQARKRGGDVQPRRLFKHEALASALAHLVPGPKAVKS